MLKIFAASSLAGMAIIGAIALANAAPNPSPSVPYKMTTSTTTTTNPPPSSGRTGY